MAGAKIMKGRLDILLVEPKGFPNGLEMGSKRGGEVSKIDSTVFGWANGKMGLSSTERGNPMDGTHL